MDDRPSELKAPPARPVRPEAVPVTRRSRWGRLIWPLLGILFLAAVAWIVFRPHAQAPRPGRFALSGPMPVVAATAVKGDMPVTFNALGTVTPLATVTVMTQISGQLMSVGFREGQEVNKGDFLAQIDPRPYQAALDQLQGQLLRDQALLKGAQIDLARYQKLAAQNSIAQQQADDQLYLVHQYEGTVKSDEAQVENAQLNLAYCHIVAPVTGRVGLRLVDPGNYVQTSSSSGLLVITQMKPISVIFVLPEDDLPAVLKRVNAGASLQVTAFDRSGKTKIATGTLSTLDNEIDPTTGTFKLRALFDNADEMLFPNQFVNVELLLDTDSGATIIPSAAIQRGAPGTFVYVVKPDDTVAVQKVALGPSDAERVAVKSGLQPGDKVVIDGADKLRDGAKVTLPAAAAHGDAAAQPAQQGQHRRSAQ
ncbi:MAG TPA: MdtA/MuxA family multidrug efflux RND transporter periplasmic adaptor subunit [Stellaceae bacterium]|nr:MdtA/MuxA family multidrug efflux RND transporter periplasmic adaptor subunit [Stellaceae bacterium]